MVRDRIVFGVHNPNIREKLINKGNELTLDSAIEMAQTYEVCKQQLKTMASPPEEVHVVRRKTSYGKSSKSKKNHQNTRPKKECPRCGGQHSPGGTCPAMGKECYRCGKANHFASKCRSNPPKVHTVNESATESDTDSDQGEHFYIGEISANCKQDEVFVPVKLSTGSKAKAVSFKLDTGAQVNVLPLKLYRKLGLPAILLKPTSIRLTSYSGNPLKVEGKVSLQGQYKETTKTLDLYVVQTSAPPVLGLKACTDMGLIKVILSVDKDKPTNFMEEFKDVFSGLGMFEGEYHIHVDPNYQPVVHPPRRIPVAIKNKVKSELDRMEKLNVIAKVTEPTAWVNSMVVVQKANSDIRICLNPKDLNQAIRRQHYRTRTLHDILPNLKDAKYFGTCDARSGYWTIKLDEESAKLTTFNTAFGRYKFLRLPFGLISSQDIFQQKIDQAYEGLEGVEPIADDILIWGNSLEEYEANQRKMLQRSREKGIKLNKEKCTFGLTEISFFGHVLSKDGLKADKKKVEAIKNMPSPTNKGELESVLGMLNYLSAFAPMLSDMTAPLRELTRKNTVFKWDCNTESIFQKVKDVITASPVLAYFDPEKETHIQVDASKNGLGATLMQDGKPVAFASKSLTETQKAYAQIEKELLAILFGCEKFHEYLYGRKVIVESDHKPLEAITKKPLASAPPRLQRMLLRLQKYDITVIHRPGKEIPVADALSRKHMKSTDNLGDEDIEAQVHAVVQNLPISDNRLNEVKLETKKDRQLQVLANVINTGWPDHKANCPAETLEYWSVREELCIIDGIIFKGDRILMPQALRKTMLDKLHIGHKGIEKCKQRARTLFYWPKLNSDIYNMITKCIICQIHRKSNTKEPLRQHDIPLNPWAKIATDLFSWNNDNYLVIVDYLSRFFEMEKLGSISSKAVITKMKRVFATHGIPQQVISDNGTQYTSQEFQSFAEDYGFIHTTISAKHPQSNGLAEKTVGIAKDLLQKCKDSSQDINLALLEYRNTPVDQIEAPSVLLMGRELRSILLTHSNHLKPRYVSPQHMKTRLRLKQQRQKRYYDQGSKPLPKLAVGEYIMMQQPNKRWKQAVVKAVHSDRSYIVTTEDGAEYRRNRIQLQKLHH